MSQEVHPRLLKVVIKTNAEDWHGVAYESIWARHLRNNGSCEVLIVENSPFFARGISYLDTICAVHTSNLMIFESILKSSGHSTYRIIRVADGEIFDKTLKELQDIGCTYESGLHAERELYAVDVSPVADLEMVYRILENGEKSGIWIFEEGNVGSIVN